MIKINLNSYVFLLCFSAASVAENMDGNIRDASGSMPFDKLENNTSLLEPGCAAEQSETIETDQVRTQHRKDLRDSFGNAALNSCVMDFNQVERRLLAGGLVIVDIRPESQFQKYRVPGSINILPHSIKTRSYLKDKHLVLVGEKKDLLDVGLLCRELRKQGFKKVNIVKEGVSAWQGKLQGSTTKSMKQWMFGLITPREFTALQSNMNWLVLDTSRDETDHSNHRLKFEDIDVMHLNTSTGNDFNKIAKHIHQQKNADISGVLVVTSDGNGYQKIGEMLESKGINDAYYLDGGMISYANYIASRQAFLARLKRGPMRNATCSGS